MMSPADVFCPCSFLTFWLGVNPPSLATEVVDRMVGSIPTMAVNERCPE
jgi:hypothetical protein